MKIHIPNSAFLGNIDPFLRGFDPSDPKILKITANSKWISVHPIVLCIIASLGLDVEPENISCEKLEAKSKHYLARMGLFHMLNIKSDISIVEHEAAGRFIPLTKIQTSNELSQFITEIVPLLHMGQDEAQTVGYVISELVRNVLEHSFAKQGAILCAQHYKKTNSIRIGIADRGVGIKKTINKSYNAETDMDAIRLALSPGVTGVTRAEGGNEQNAGAGLFFIKSIASVNRDFFAIYTGNGFYKLLKKSKQTHSLKLHADPFKDRHSKDSNMPYWQGTVVGIDITLDRTAEFTLLLDAIRSTYGAAIKERKKIGRKPKFI